MFENLSGAGGAAAVVFFLSDLSLFLYSFIFAVISFCLSILPQYISFPEVPLQYCLITSVLSPFLLHLPLFSYPFSS